MPAAVVPRGAGQRILYVDDDDAIVMLIEKTLLGLGYRVKGFDDSRAAALYIKEHPMEFDIVVTDLSMPQLGGFDIARAVKSVRPTVPIIVTSGYVRDKDREQAAALGIENLILKPNTIDELGKVLDGLCKKL
jgi:CheY-like chemotaxis protein